MSLGHSLGRGAAAVLASLSLLVTASAGGPAQAATGLEGFDPGNIISNDLFFDAKVMTPDAVAAFIAVRGASCVPGPDGTPCLKDHLSDIPATPATPYCKGAVTAKTAATAAEVISSAAQACDINPQVLLVMLQKEQALVTGSGDRLQADRYTKAMGLGCPDFQQCDPQRATFFGQVYGAAERFRIYQAHPERYRHKVGVNQIAYHPEPICGEARVVIQNQATAGLYNYTPYVPNKASLAAVTAEGDLCSAYGNRNFYRYFKTWFPESVSASDAPPIEASPASVVTPQMSAILQYANQVGSAALGPATGPIVCKDGRCTKPYTLATITWTAKAGAHIGRQVARIAGPTRYPTAAEASRRSFPAGAAPVYVAAGTSFADALAAGPQARAAAAPILLTAPQGLPDETRQEVRRLAPTSIVVVGGPINVAESVIRELKELRPGATVIRLSGDTRYETALAVSRGFPAASRVHVAGGENFPDALVSGSLTAGVSPLLLVPSSGALPPGFAQEVARLGATSSTILGGPMSVGLSAETELGRLGAVDRVSGQSRYATAVAVARRAFTGGVQHIYLTSGENYPDALVAVSLQAQQPGPMLLAKVSCLPKETHDYISARPGVPVTLIGGTATLGASVSELKACP